MGDLALDKRSVGLLGIDLLTTSLVSEIAGQEGQSTCPGLSCTLLRQVPEPTGASASSGRQPCCPLADDLTLLTMAPVVEKAGVSGLECGDLGLLNERQRSVSRQRTALTSSS